MKKKQITLKYLRKAVKHAQKCDNICSVGGCGNKSKFVFITTTGKNLMFMGFCKKHYETNLHIHYI